MTHRQRRSYSDSTEVCPRCQRFVDPDTIDCPYCGQTINDAEAILG